MPRLRLRRPNSRCPSFLKFPPIPRVSKPDFKCKIPEGVSRLGAVGVVPRIVRLSFVSSCSAVDGMTGWRGAGDSFRTRHGPRLQQILKREWTSRVEADGFLVAGQQTIETRFCKSWWSCWLFWPYWGLHTGSGWVGTSQCSRWCTRAFPSWARVPPESTAVRREE